jgi:hypothetical protein
MLRRYHIIDLEDLRRAAEQSSRYAGRVAPVTPLRPENSHITATQTPEGAVAGSRS